MKPPLVERNILDSTKSYLAWEGFHSIRIHCGRCMRGKYWLNLAAEGTPDLMVTIPAGRPIVNPWTEEPEVSANFARIAWIETKHPGRGKQSPAQKDFQRQCQEDGSLYYLIRDVERLRYYLPPKAELDFHRRSA